MSSKADRGNAERAAEHWCHSLGCIKTVRAVRTKWQRQDLFAGDCLGKDAQGRLFVVQATAGKDSAVTARKRKLEAIPWAPSDFVAVAQLRTTQDPANRRKKCYYFRVLEYASTIEKPGRSWIVWEDAVEVPRAWFKATSKVE